MYNSSEFRKGLKVEIDGAPWIIIENQFVKPGKGQAFNRVRLKNLMTGSVLDRTIRSGDSLQKADVTGHTMQFLYQQGDEYHFMNTSSYEQIAMTAEQLGETAAYLTENLEVEVSLWDGKPISVDPPTFVELQITECEPGVRGDTAQGATKPATLSTGHVANVPLFVEEGEWIRIDTRNGAYVDRVKK